MAKPRNDRFGLSPSSYKSLHRKWSDMIQRTKNPKNINYHNYGGRGISVCNEWIDSSTFILWGKNTGYKEGLQIDRIDSNGNYCPENCRFVTPSEQQSNRRKPETWGIYPKGNRYCVSIGRNYKLYYGGRFGDIESAIKQRDLLLTRINNNDHSLISQKNETSKRTDH